MPDRPPTPPKREFSWSAVLKKLVFWVLLAAVTLVFLHLSSAGQEKALEVTYTAFDQQLAQGNVSEVTVEEGKRLTGRFKQPVRVKDKESTRFYTDLPFQNDPNDLERLRAANVIIRGSNSKGSITLILIQALPYVLLFGISMLIFRQMQAGGAKAFSFGKSKAKLLSGDTPKVTFADVAGADEAKAELQEIIEFLRDPQRFTRLGGRLPKGVLLVGPPGTGKTLLARAVAGEAGRPFFSMSGSDFVEMFVGVGASRVRDLFEQGKAHAPCIIFIDEIDAVGRHRGAGLGGGHDEREQTLNQLLVEMDGFDSSKGVIIMAATNRPEVLDAALLRAGRFDRQVVVDRPDVRGRAAILQVHARHVRLAPEVSLQVIAARTPGFAGADLANIVNEAALLAARKGKDAVGQADLEEAIDRVVAGLERKSRVLSETERDIVAHHEMGHALVAFNVAHADPVHKITIIPRGVAALGMTYQLPTEDRFLLTRSELEDRIAVLLGGRVAEELVYGEVSTGAHNDLERATEMARLMVMQYGMSEQLGPMTFGGGPQAMFLRGSGLPQEREYSEESARRIDGETRSIIDRI
ncbi:MAG TPA: ATP-dependent zinc metalloprotease FtsH, partial [Gemmatimonadaceae bacterium]|nr:ATP-dependent zinc metalloprotease FtsH [Gemmatimonadaceae bacterium]